MSPADKAERLLAPLLDHQGARHLLEPLLCIASDEKLCVDCGEVALPGSAVCKPCWLGRLTHAVARAALTPEEGP